MDKYTMYLNVGIIYG